MNDALQIVLSKLRVSAKDPNTERSITQREVTALAEHLEELRSRAAVADEVVNACRGTQMDEAGIAAVQKLANELAIAKQDGARMDWLQDQVQHPNYWHDIMICWDHEDGIWVSDVRKGDVHSSSILSGYEKTPTIRAAIDAARRVRP